MCVPVLMPNFYVIEETESYLATHFPYHLHNLGGLSWPKFVFIFFFFLMEV